MGTWGGGGVRGVFYYVSYRVFLLWRYICICNEIKHICPTFWSIISLNAIFTALLRTMGFDVWGEGVELVVGNGVAFV